MKEAPIINQLLVAGSTLAVALSAGGVVGFPGVLLHQITANDTSIAMDFDTASWMGSIHGLAGVPSIFMPTIMQWRGRKFAYITTCLLILTGWVLTYSATNVVTLLLGESFHGLGGHSLVFLSFSTISEMITPKFRNAGLLAYPVVMALAIVLVTVMDRFYHWKTIALVMSAPTIVALLMACAWIESPSWLACKGEFDKCKKAFICLKGTSEDSIKELKELIAAQKKIVQSSKNSANGLTFKRFCSKITGRDFFLPASHMIVMLAMIYWSGFMVLLIYATKMIEKTTKNEDAVFVGGIVINSMYVLGTFASTILTFFFNNKPILLLSSCGSALCLFCATTVTYLQSVGTLSNDSLLCFYCLIGNMAAASLGIGCIAYTVAAELMPVKHRGVGGALYTICTCVLHSSSLKIAPYLFRYMDLWGTLLIYTIVVVLCSWYVWKFVPETKNRTLQELEDYFMYGHFDKQRGIDDDLVCVPIV